VEVTSDEASCLADEDAKFCSSSNVYLRGRPGALGDSVESSTLDESWPDSERPSTVE